MDISEATTTQQIRFEDDDVSLLDTTDEEYYWEPLEIDNHEQDSFEFEKVDINDEDSINSLPFLEIDDNATCDIIDDNTTSEWEYMEASELENTQDLINSVCKCPDCLSVCQEDITFPKNVIEMAESRYDNNWLSQNVDVSIKKRKHEEFKTEEKSCYEYGNIDEEDKPAKRQCRID